MKEGTATNVGVNKKQASVIIIEMENKSWSTDILGEDSPEKLNTVQFMTGMKATLRAVKEHYHLHREMPNKASQL